MTPIDYAECLVFDMMVGSPLVIVSKFFILPIFPQDKKVTNHKNKKSLGDGAIW